MEQIFAVFGVEWKLLLVNIVNFAVLVILLSYILYKPVIKLLDERKLKIEKGLKDAELAEEKLAEIKEKESQIVADARKKAQEILSSSEDLAEKEKEAILQEAQAKALTALASAKRQAQEEKKKLVQEAKDLVAKDVVLAAEKILKAN